MMPQVGKRIEVQGHRGCRGLRPENTMAGFRHAIELGVDVLELDLALSKDHVLLVTHDPEVNDQICVENQQQQLPSRSYKDLTFAQVQSLDCGTRRHPKHAAQVTVPGERIPRLEQVLDLLRDHPRLRLNIEIKTFPERPERTWPPGRFAETLVPLLRRRRSLRRVTVQSFDPAALQAVARLDPGIALSALADRRGEMEPMLAATGAKILSPRFTELRREDVTRFHARGVRVIPWTVNEPKQMQRLISWGVDGIITDRPDLLLKLLR